MPKRDWRNGLAIGLIVGGGLTISLIVVMIGLNYCPGEPCNYTRFGLSEPPMTQGKPNEAVGEPQTAQGEPTEEPAVEAPSDSGNTTAADQRAQGHEAQVTSDAKGEGDEPYFPWNDGLAQWIMAAFSVAAVGVSAWAVILVRKSLRTTDLALDEAKTANGIAREVGEAQAMAYCGFNGVEVGWIGGGVSVKPSLKNYGETPAYNASWRVHGTVIPDAGVPWTIPETGLPYFYMIMPGEPDTVPGVQIGAGHAPGVALVDITLTLDFGDIFRESPHRSVTETWIGRLGPSLAGVPCIKTSAKKNPSN